jgi:hypothetical protein
VLTGRAGTISLDLPQMDSAGLAAFKLLGTGKAMAHNLLLTDRSDAKSYDAQTQTFDGFRVKLNPSSSYPSCTPYRIHV